MCRADISSSAMVCSTKRNKLFCLASASGPRKADMRVYLTETKACGVHVDVGGRPRLSVPVVSSHRTAERVCQRGNNAGGPTPSHESGRAGEELLPLSRGSRRLMIRLEQDAGRVAPRSVSQEPAAGSVDALASCSAPKTTRPAQC